MLQLPPANMNSLDIILDTCHRLAEKSSINEMDASALAECLVPSLIWRQNKVRLLRRMI